MTVVRRVCFITLSQPYKHGVAEAMFFLMALYTDDEVRCDVLRVGSENPRASRPYVYFPFCAIISTPFRNSTKLVWETTHLKMVWGTFSTRNINRY